MVDKDLLQQGIDAMATELFTSNELIELTESVRERIAEAFQQTKLSGEDDAHGDLKSDVFDLLDIVVAQAERLDGSNCVGNSRRDENTPKSDSSIADSGGRANDETNRSSGLPAELTTAVIDCLDETLSHWQLQIASAVERAGAKEFGSHVAALERLQHDLDAKSKRLELDQVELDRRLAETSKLQTRLVRQRKTIAKELRAKHAELRLLQHEELAKARTTLRAELEAEIRANDADHHTGDVSALQARIDELESREYSHVEEVTQLKQRNKSLQIQNDGLQEKSDSLSEQSIDRDSRVQSLERELVEANELTELLQLELADANAKLASCSPIEKANDQPNDSVEVEQLRIELQTAAERLAQFGVLESELLELRIEHELALSQLDSAKTIQEEASEIRRELEEIRSNATTLVATDDRLEELESLLKEQSNELEDLRQQNSDLAAQLARQQVASSGSFPHVSFNQESLTWEERKRLIMQQLDADSKGEDNSPEAAIRRLEVEDLLLSTQRELERKEREIGELQAILEQQSSAHGGMAIGAAAIAQMFDTDDLICQERQKLKAIQEEWEQKLRQAEIDLSMERAKLARERLELEEQRSQTQELRLPTIETDTNKGRTRKWLEHLGLREEKRDGV